MNTSSATPSTNPFGNVFPGFDQFPQGMDFLKQFWSHNAAAPTAASAASPAFQQAIGQYFMPTLDAQELDKRITDLRTVLQFMELNTQLLRQSMQALEVQRNTVAALHSMMQGNAAATDSPEAAAKKNTTKKSTSASTSRTSSNSSSKTVAKKNQKSI